MTISGFTADRDPRTMAGPDELTSADVRSAPEVGRMASPAEGLGLAVGLIGAAALGGLTILGLAHHRTAAPSKPPPVTAAAAGPDLTRPAPVTPVAAPQTTSGPAANASVQTPILVVDGGAASMPAPLAPTKAAPPPSPSLKSDASFSQDEQFATRFNDDAAPTSHVRRLDHPDKVVAQGALIPAVLETALDSDLPGYARALVSREVRSFDGSQVLIPRGSRLVGQYKSALQTGQSRMLIVWTRLLRPDGVTIQLGSPTTDDLGAAGLSGKVDRHFLQRYGSAILLSVVGGLTSVAAPTNTVVIGTASQGTSAAAVALQNDVKVSPTVRVMQGTAIQVFVARDLDFSEEAQ